MIDWLVRGLAADAKLTADEIMDVLWLSAVREVPETAPSIGNVKQVSPPSQERVPEPSFPESADIETEAPPPGSDSPVPLHLASESEDGGESLSATEIGLGSPRPLRDPLGLPRALRRFKQIRTPGHRILVDIDATVEATADADRLVIVFTRPQERALDVALVIDESPSMRIWDASFDEFERQLMQTGAFRAVSRWRLTTRADKVRLRDPHGTHHPPRRLVDPSGNRLVLVATDAAHEHWYKEELWTAVATWCTTMPTALVQVLPANYWANGALGDPYIAGRARRPGSPNTQYARRPAWWATDPGGPILPIVTLSAQILDSWAQAAVSGTAWIDGITATPPDAEYAPSAAGQADPGVLLNDFLARASDGAEHLAHVLASAATLSVPLIHVLQEQLAPETSVTELAEVLASGLLQEIRPAATGQQQRFRFHDGAREILQRGVTTFEEWDAYEAVSRYLAEKPNLGGPLRARIRDPAGSTFLDSDDEPFAGLRRSLAIRLGLPIVLADPQAQATGGSAIVRAGETERSVSRLQPYSSERSALWKQAVRVFASRGNLDSIQGTGYAVGGRLILTSGETVAIALKQSDSIRIRRKGEQEWSARVVWTSADRNVIALEVTDPGWTAAPQVGLSRLEPQAGSKCQLIGFPAQKQRPEWSGHVEYVRGYVSSSSAIGVSPQTLQIRVDQPVDWSIWDGMSGAPLFQGELLVGIVVSGIGQRTDAPLSAVAVTSFVDTPGFMGAAAPHWGLASPPEGLGALEAPGNAVDRGEIPATDPSKTTELLWKSKLLVVGEGAVGKTSLVKSLTGQGYDPSEPTTHGIRIVELGFIHPSQPDTQIRLSAWDFGGQDIYHATYQPFLSDRSLFALVWNARQGWEQAKLTYWLGIIAARAPHSRVILVATHAHDRPTDLPLTDLRASFSQIVASSAVDNATGEGIEELRQIVAEEAARLPLVGSQWPSTWVAAAEAITTSGFQYATLDDLHNQLSASGVTDGNQQTSLLRALHLLGDILYFDEDEELRDMVILQPQWVNGYIAKVLDSSEVAAKQGLLTRHHERELWSDLNPAVQDRLLQLMEKFDLSYRITDDPAAASLVVERLPWDIPPYQEQWDAALSQPDAREIRLRYQLNLLPPGIPTWFIAREHRFSTGTHWRSGALLSHTGDPRVLALIRAERRDATVDLTVRGPMPQLFFSVLRDGFESTLGRYQGLEITRLVPCKCAHGNGTQPGRPCIHMYQYDPLLRRMERGVLEVECELSFMKVSVTDLLFGIVPTTTDQLVSRLDNIDQSLDAFRVEAAWAHREFLKNLRRGQARAGGECPSVFTIIPASRRSERPGIHQVELRLYCEQPGEFHPLSEAPYVINQPSSWLVTMSSYLMTLVSILKHTPPLVAPVLGFTSAFLANQLQDEIRLMEELVSQLSDDIRSENDANRFGTGDSQSDAVADFGYRALRQLLHQLDPTDYWAGLSRIYTPEGEILWLCRDHARGYSI